MLRLNLARRKTIISQSFAMRVDQLETHLAAFRANNMMVPEAWNEWEPYVFVTWLFTLGIVNSGIEGSSLSKLQRHLSTEAARYLRTRLSRRRPYLSEPYQRRMFEAVLGTLEARLQQYSRALERDKAQVRRSSASNMRYVPGTLVVHSLAKNCVSDPTAIDRFVDYSTIFEDFMPNFMEIVRSVR